ncbi:hypothetical protein [Acinetobacter baumannii]|uniref:hypothetical protein n=3 Tax=Gammaproteobacteria TaxID=1236 RepID=UPI0007F93C1A|nr:hypothetical protein [Acinetobacter baumannii]MBF1877378.1 hypothetical protein [Acinetobacter baumannii]MBJ9443374.1 hypothetical protein [Acinetobacter baumannii]MDA5045068.1 hypothetical protein [Acinetobacter baumannii]MDC5198225.1 hypothetical protein [Acinetobacter baumannii]MDC5283575.1 hypothetical protein [Acinetobacter baumannii]
MEELIPDQLLEQIDRYEKNVLDSFYYTSNKFNQLKFEEITSPTEFDNGNRYDKILKVISSSPPLDYTYLREELLKNPFQIASVESTYIFCLCKDARSKIHSSSLIEANSIIQRIQKVHETTHNIIKAGIEYIAISPNMTFCINEEETKQSTYQDKLYYLPHFKIHFLQALLDVSPDDFIDRKTTLTDIRQEIEYILPDYYKQILYNELNKIFLENGEKWKSVSLAATQLENKINEKISELIDSNKDHFTKGRKELIKFYRKMIERLNTEINDNIWLQQNTEDNSNAKAKVAKLTVILSIEKKLYENIDNLKFLRRKGYNTQTFKNWIRENISKPEWKKLFKE